MPRDLPPGGASVSRRAIADIVRAAALGSYGVTGLASSPIDRILAWFGIGHSGISIQIDETALDVDLALEIAYGLPVAEVARQVDSAVRYSIKRALERELGELRISVDGLVIRPLPDVEAIARSRGQVGASTAKNPTTKRSAASPNGRPPGKRSGAATNAAPKRAATKGAAPNGVPETGAGRGPLGPRVTDA